MPPGLPAAILQGLRRQASQIRASQLAKEGLRLGRRSELFAREVAPRQAVLETELRTPFEGAFPQEVEDWFSRAAHDERLYYPVRPARLPTGQVDPTAERSIEERLRDLGRSVDPAEYPATVRRLLYSEEGARRPVRDVWEDLQHQRVLQEADQYDPVKEGLTSDQEVLGRNLFREAQDQAFHNRPSPVASLYGEPTVDSPAAAPRSTPSSAEGEEVLELGVTPRPRRAPSEMKVSQALAAEQQHEPSPGDLDLIIEDLLQGRRNVVVLSEEEIRALKDGLLRAIHEETGQTHEFPVKSIRRYADPETGLTALDEATARIPSRPGRRGRKLRGDIYQGVKEAAGGLPPTPQGVLTQWMAETGRKDLRSLLQKRPTGYYRVELDLPGFPKTPSADLEALKASLPLKTPAALQRFGLPQGPQTSLPLRTKPPRTGDLFEIDETTGLVTKAPPTPPGDRKGFEFLLGKPASELEQVLLRNKAYPLLERYFPERHPPLTKPARIRSTVEEPSAWDVQGRVALEEALETGGPVAPAEAPGLFEPGYAAPRDNPPTPNRQGGPQPAGSTVVGPGSPIGSSISLASGGTWRVAHVRTAPLSSVEGTQAHIQRVFPGQHQTRYGKTSSKFRTTFREGLPNYEILLLEPHATPRTTAPARPPRAESDRPFLVDEGERLGRYRSVIRRLRGTAKEEAQWLKEGFEILPPEAQIQEGDQTIVAVNRTTGRAKATQSLSDPQYRGTIVEIAAPQKIADVSSSVGTPPRTLVLEGSVAKGTGKPWTARLIQGLKGPFGHQFIGTENPFADPGRSPAERAALARKDTRGFLRQSSERRLGQLAEQSDGLVLYVREPPPTVKGPKRSSPDRAPLFKDPEDPAFLANWSAEEVRRVAAAKGKPVLLVPLVETAEGVVATRSPAEVAQWLATQGVRRVGLHLDQGWDSEQARLAPFGLKDPARGEAYLEAMTAHAQQALQESTGLPVSPIPPPRGLPDRAPSSVDAVVPPPPAAIDPLAARGPGARLDLEEQFLRAAQRQWRDQQRLGERAHESAQARIRARALAQAAQRGLLPEGLISTQHGWVNEDPTPLLTARRPLSMDAPPEPGIPRAGEPGRELAGGGVSKAQTPSLEWARELIKKLGPSALALGAIGAQRPTEEDRGAEGGGRPLLEAGLGGGLQELSEWLLRRLAQVKAPSAGPAPKVPPPAALEPTLRAGGLGQAITSPIGDYAKAQGVEPSRQLAWKGEAALLDHLVPTYVGERIARLKGEEIPDRLSTELRLPALVSGSGGVHELAFTRSLKAPLRAIEDQGLAGDFESLLIMATEERYPETFARHATYFQKQEADALLRGDWAQARKFKADRLRAVTALKEQQSPLGWAPGEGAAKAEAYLAQHTPEERALLEQGLQGARAYASELLTELSPLLEPGLAKELASRDSLFVPVRYLQGTLDPEHNLLWKAATQRLHDAQVKSQGRLSVAEEKIIQQLRGQGEALLTAPKVKSLTEWGHRVVQEVGRNTSARLIIDNAQALKLPYVKPYVEGTRVAPGMTVLSYLDQGVTKSFEVPVELAMAASLAPPPVVSGALGKLLGMGRALMHTMATGGNLAFVLRNVPRDVQDAFMLTPGLSPDQLPAFMGLWKRNVEEIAQGIITPMREQYYRAGADFSSLMKQLDPEVAMGRFSWKHPLRPIQQLLNATEQATKESVFELLSTAPEATRMSPERVAAVTRRFGGSPDFGLWGSVTAQARDFVMFFNPQVQGAARTIRRWRERPDQMLGWLAGITLAQLALDQYNRGFLNEDTGRPELEDIPERERTTSLIIMQPGAKEVDRSGKRRQPYLRIPLGHAAKLLFVPVQDAIRAAWDEPSVHPAETAVNTIGQLLPGTLTIDPEQPLGSMLTSTVAGINPVLKWLPEQYTDLNTFTGTPIVGRQVSQFPAWAQATPQTSPFLRELGQLAGRTLPGWLSERAAFSPARQEHTLRTFFPGPGEMALGALDYPLAEPATTLREGIVQAPVVGPLLRSFLQSPTSQVREDLANTLYRTAQEADQAKAYANSLLRSGKTEEARTYLQDPRIQRLVRIHPQLTSLIRHRAQIDRRRRASQTLSPEVRHRLWQQELALLRQGAAIVEGSAVPPR